MHYKPESFKTLYTGYIAGLVISFTLFFFAGAADAAMGHLQGDPPSLPALLLMLLGVGAMIAGVVAYMMLLYRAWNQIQDGTVRTTPGKAVGFLFIPLFNLYWMFVAFYGLSQDLNAYTTQRGIQTARVSEGLALTSCILTVCAIIPCLGILAAIAAIPVQLISLWQMVGASRAIALSKGGMPPPLPGTR